MSDDPAAPEVTSAPVSTTTVAPEEVKAPEAEAPAEDIGIAPAKPDDAASE